jgi:hypothetical protein
MRALLLVVVTCLPTSAVAKGKKPTPLKCTPFAIPSEWRTCTSTADCIVGSPIIKDGPALNRAHEKEAQELNHKFCPDILGFIGGRRYEAACEQGACVAKAVPEGKGQKP